MPKDTKSSGYNKAPACESRGFGYKKEGANFDTPSFYWSRSRILEKLNSLPPGTLPEGVQPALGPDATALGQIYWYTLEGRDPATGKPTGGWNAEELRTIQDYYVKYSLSAAEGVSEVASAGGFVKEYQVELNPDAMRAFNVSVMDIMGAIKKSNLDIGAETMEINKVEYLIRGLGYIKDVSDLEKAVVTVRDGVPVRISDVAFVNIGPGTRRGGLDKEGVEAVGGVVIARYGSNPLEVINNVKDKIKEMASGLPQKTLPDGTVSKITVVPFYDRTGLIKETIGTLETSLSHEILICIIVIIVLVLNLRASVVIASMLPIAVLSTFIIMRYTGIAANIVALSGIAIAIGVMVDVGVVFVESIIRYMEMPENRDLLRNGGTYNPADGFRLIPADSLIPDRKGDYFRQWRPEIKNTDDIWQQIVNVTHLPGLTSAPKLQPIEARLVMLSTGMRAPMGLKIYGPDLETIEQSGKAIEQALKDVPSVIPSSVFYDRAVGAPYLEIKLNRDNMARYGVNVEDLQEILSAAVGGMILTKTVEGRERFPVRLRYARELRDNPEALSMLLVPTATGAQIPLKELADIEYARGAQMIQSENTFLVGYVIFDKKQGKAEVDVVKEATKVIEGKIQNGELKLTKGVSYKFAGNYEQQERATARLMIVVPLALLIVLLVLYFQFKTLTASLIHFSGVFVAFAGGFILLWLYGQDWFMNFSLAGVNMRDLFQMHTINLSVAVWVGFIALFGVATDDGVLMGTYIHHVFLEKDPQTRHDIREAVVTAGLKRVRPAAMTTATTLIALLPVLTSTGKGADIMVPMAIPTFGGMLIQSMTMFVVPVFQCWWREGLLKKEEKARNAAENSSPGK